MSDKENKDLIPDLSHVEGLDLGQVRPEDLIGMRGDGTPKWYVIHTYSGHENKVKTNLEKVVQNRGLQPLIQKIVVPTQEVTDRNKKNEPIVVKKKIFPGYVVLKMIVTNETWYLVRNTQGVTGFVGHGTNPLPLTLEEVRRMGLEKVDIDMDLNEGDEIRVINGAWAGYEGTVKLVNPKKETIKAKLQNEEGNEITINLNFAEVDKID